jgi:hypothetical protein
MENSGPLSGGVTGVRVELGGLSPSEIKSASVSGGLIKYRRLKSRMNSSSAANAALHWATVTLVRVLSS